MRIVVLAGGVGGARFLLGVRAAARADGHDVDAIVNVGDDAWVAGLRITPDLDSIMYALAGVNDLDRGWGRAGESERVSAELAAWGVGWPWFTLGDLDLGAHIARTAWLREGVPLGRAARRLAARWDIGVTLRPASDDEAETWVVTDDGDLHFQEWWTRHRASLPARAFVTRSPGPVAAGEGVLEAIAAADAVLLAPSNPVVSIATILGVPGVREALAATRARVVGVSPILGGAVLRGMADACLTTIGVETSADAVARHYGARERGGLLDGWLVDEVDAAIVPALEADGFRAAAMPLILHDDHARLSIARAAITLALEQI
jgi:LPPG:FO 2-phospho-L-lactate transferase